MELDACEMKTISLRLFISSSGFTLNGQINYNSVFYPVERFFFSTTIVRNTPRNTESIIVAVTKCVHRINLIEEKYVASKAEENLAILFHEKKVMSAVL